MDCEKFRRMLDDYENLTEEEKLALAEHTAVCEECRKEYDFFMSIISSARALPKLDVPDDFLENVNKRIDSEKNYHGAKIVRMLQKDWRKYGSIAACLVVAVVIGINGDMLVSRMTPEDDGVVISENKNTSGSEDNSESMVNDNTEIASADNAESVAEAGSEAASVPSAGETAAVGKTVVPASEGTPLSIAESTAVPKTSGTSSAFAARNALRASAAPSANNDASNRAAAQPSYTETPTAVAEEDNETAQVQSQITVQETVSDDDNAVKSSAAEVAEEASEEPYTLARSGYAIPRTYSNAYDVKQDSDNTVSSYSITDEDSDAALASADNIVKSRAAEQVQNVGSIYVGVQDSDEFMSIVNTYISGSEDEYYLITAGNLSAMLGELSESGINYGEFMDSSVNGQVAFSVVFF